MNLETLFKATDYLRTNYADAPLEENACDLLFTISTLAEVLSVQAFLNTYPDDEFMTERLTKALTVYAENDIDDTLESFLG